MSAVSSSTTPDLYQWLQNIAAPGSSASTATSAPAAATPGDPTDPDGASTQGAGGASGHRHHHGHKISSQLESAITSALSADGGKSDPNQVVEDTIKNFLAAGHPAADGSTANPSDPNSATPSATATDPSSAQSSFDAVLQSYGIDADQFKQDLQSAVQNGNGSVDFSQLFQNLPVGSTVDTTA